MLYKIINRTKYMGLDITKSLCLAPMPIFVILGLISLHMMLLSLIYLAIFPFLLGFGILLNKYKLLNLLTIFTTALITLFLLTQLFSHLLYANYMLLIDFIYETMLSLIGISVLVTAFNFWALLIWYNYKRIEANTISVKPD